MVEGEGSAFAHPELVEFFSHGRCRPEDLYPSERRFLPWLAARTGSVLDAGCAAGGFADIWRHFEPTVRYVGTDVSPPLVEAARRLRPEHRFDVADTVDGLPFSDRSFDTVQALGWLHWETRYEQALVELWRVAADRLFFDVRLRPSGSGTMVGEQRLAYAGEWDGETRTPYVALDMDEFLGLVAGLRVGRVLGYGYEGPLDGSVVGVPDPVCFATFVLERSGPADGEVPLVLEVPWEVDVSSTFVVTADLDGAMVGGDREGASR